jgi:plastocyanin
MATASTRPRGRAGAIAALLASSAALAACGSGGGEAERLAASPPHGATATIDMADLRFSPRHLTVARGATVTFRNVGKVTHNAKGSTFFSRVVEPEGSYKHTYDTNGTFPFVCTFHPGMNGELTVR